MSLPATAADGGRRPAVTRLPYLYNAERANQALSCDNQPPWAAFLSLPALPRVPDWVDPDRWLETYDRRIFRRWVSANGTVMVDKYLYSVGTAFTGQRIALHFDAQQRTLQVQQHDHLVKSLPLQGVVDRPMAFQEYLRLMLEEARSIERHLRLKALQRRA